MTVEEYDRWFRRGQADAHEAFNQGHSVLVHSAFDMANLRPTVVPYAAGWNDRCRALGLPNADDNP